LASNTVFQTAKFLHTTRVENCGHFPDYVKFPDLSFRSHMTYNVFSGTLNRTQSFPMSGLTLGTVQRRCK